MDETYKRMWISPRVRPLLTTDNPNSDRVLAWIGPCDHIPGGRHPAGPWSHRVQPSLVPDVGP